MITEKEQKRALQTYICENCDFMCVKKNNYNKHLMTRKHANNDEQLQKRSKKMPIQYSCDCGKEYVYRQGLYAHKKTCIASLHKQNKPIEQTTTETQPEDVKVLSDMVKELMKSNAELQKQLITVCKNTSNNTTTNINSNNNTFNLHFFLNEQCKDAMNISDFINTFDLQLEDLEAVGELGYVDGITKIIVDKLNSMDIYKRPLHCSDAKREILYIKDEDKWEKETKNNPKLRHAIKTISFKNMKLTNLWSDTYPESKSGDSILNDKYMKLIKQSTGGNGEISVNEDKIIKRIAKEIVIEKK